MTVVKVEYSLQQSVAFYTYRDGGIVGFPVRSEDELMERVERHRLFGITSDKFLTESYEEYRKEKAKAKDWKTIYGGPQLRLVK